MKENDLRFAGNLIRLQMIGFHGNNVEVILYGKG